MTGCAVGAGSVAMMGSRYKALAASKHVFELNDLANRDVYTSCGMCVNKCGVIARVRNGVIEKLDPNPNFLKSRGMLCARGNAGVDAVYSPDRIKYPMIRTGERGDGKFRRASWEEALDLVAKNLTSLAEKYTRAGTVFVSTEGYQEHFFTTFAECYGSPNTLRHPTLCLASNIQGFGATFGTNPTPDVLNADYIIMSGANRSEALVTPDSIDMITGDGGKRKIVYLDPRFTKTAAKADEWYPVKPGTDMAFMLGMIHVIVKEELYDPKFIEEMTVGFDELVLHIEQYSPEWAEEECEIPAADIRRIAREFAAAAPKAVYYQGRRSSFFDNDTQMRRAMAILNAITGNWDRQGGMVPNGRVALQKHDYTAPWYDDVPERLEKGTASYLSEKDGSWKYFRDRVLEGKPYPVKGMLVYKQNPLVSVANRQKTLEMMKQMEFICTIDITMNDTAIYSDVILPEATYLERQDPIESLGGILPVVTSREPCIEPMYESKPNLWIMQELAKRLDKEIYASFDFTMEEYRHHQVKKNPEILKALKEKGVYFEKTTPTYGKTQGKRLKTKSGKIEIYSAKYAKKGLDPLPVYRRPVDVPKGKYRIILGRNAYMTHGTTANNLYLNDIMPENRLWLNTAEARKKGLKDGQMVKVKSPLATEELRLTVTEKIRPDCVYLSHGFGVLSKNQRLLAGKGGSDAALIEDKVEPISGNMAMHQTFVDVSPA
jgi:thiosulfate reductase/polysulfide reductase chain A